MAQTDWWVQNTTESPNTFPSTGVGITDSGNNFAATNVETVTAELADHIEDVEGLVLTCTATFEAEAGGTTRDVTVQVCDLNGDAVAGVKKVKISTLAATADKGDLAAPGTLPRPARST